VSQCSQVILPKLGLRSVTGLLSTPPCVSKPKTDVERLKLQQGDETGGNAATLTVSVRVLFNRWAEATANSPRLKAETGYAADSGPLRLGSLTSRRARPIPCVPPSSDGCK
jgi:hypothetical protein